MHGQRKCIWRMSRDWGINSLGRNRRYVVQFLRYPLFVSLPYTHMNICFPAVYRVWSLGKILPSLWWVGAWWCKTANLVVLFGSSDCVIILFWSMLPCRNIYQSVNDMHELKLSLLLLLRTVSHYLFYFKLCNLTTFLWFKQLKMALP